MYRLVRFFARYHRTFSTAVQEDVKHVPVLSTEVIQYLNPQPGQRFLDMTFGAGGHTRLILGSGPDITVFGLDRDPVAHEFARELSQIHPNFVPLLGRFSDLPKLLSELNITANSLDGVLIDCGCSSMQFDTSERGFSISRNGPLDMRMDKGRLPGQPTAAEILSHIDEESLVRVLKVYGEEKLAKKIARGIIESRYLLKDIRTTGELAELVASIVGYDSRSDKLQRSSHVATKTFQALRILVNDELNELDFGIKAAHYYLKTGGKLVTIAFHSLEDRIVKSNLTGIPIKSTDDLILKSHAAELSQEDMNQVLDRQWESLTKHVIVPTDEEVELNPRSRSARMRVAVKKR